MRQAKQKINRFWKVLKGILFWSLTAGVISVLAIGFGGAPLAAASMVGYLIGSIWHYVLIMMIAVGLMRHWIKKGGKKK